MSKIKAYAIHSIVRRENGKKITVPASTEQNITVFDLDEDEFDTLESLGAVRKASKEEVALAKARSHYVEDAPTNVEKAVAHSKEAKTPAANTKADKNGTQKNTTDTEEKKSEEKPEVKADDI